MPGNVNDLKAAVSPVNKHDARARDGERVQQHKASVSLLKSADLQEWKRSRRITLQNQSFCEMLSYSNQELIYSPSF